jgi:hypothetical protein
LEGGGSEHPPRLTRGGGTAVIPPIPRPSKLEHVRGRIDRPPLDGGAGDPTAGGDRDAPVGYSVGDPPGIKKSNLINERGEGKNYRFLGFVGFSACAI